MIGTLNAARVPVVRIRDRAFRDFSGVIGQGVAIRSLVDVELEQRLAGEAMQSEAASAESAEARDVPWWQQ